MDSQVGTVGLHGTIGCIKVPESLVFTKVCIQAQISILTDFCNDEVVSELIEVVKGHFLSIDD